MKNKFWNKVYKCKHKNISPDYLNLIGCVTPYCEATETHCLDCGVFIIECGCHFCEGLSGWPESRHRMERKKQESIEANKTLSYAG